MLRSIVSWQRIGIVLAMLGGFAAITVAQPVEQAILTSSDGELGDEFGFSVDVDGAQAIVGDRKHDTYTGAAYIFEFAEGVWLEKAKLTASDGEALDYCGRAVSIDGSYTFLKSRPAAGWTPPSRPRCHHRKTSYLASDIPFRFKGIMPSPVHGTPTVPLRRAVQLMCLSMLEARGRRSPS